MIQSPADVFMNIFLIILQQGLCCSGVSEVMVTFKRNVLKINRFITRD